LLILENVGFMNQTVKAIVIIFYFVS